MPGVSGSRGEPEQRSHEGDDRKVDAAEPLSGAVRAPEHTGLGSVVDGDRDPDGPLAGVTQLRDRTPGQRRMRYGQIALAVGNADATELRAQTG